MKIIELFKIKREERMPALAALLLSAALNALVIYAYYGKFSRLCGNYKWYFVKNFHISGYDPLTYNVVTDWDMRYNVFRHPLLAPFMYIPSVINQGLMSLTGINCVQFVVAVILILFTVYSFVFLYRIFREVLDLGRTDSLVLASLNYSFAYVLLASAVPDHFILSMSALIMTLYICGMKMRGGRRLTRLQTVLLFILTAGISLNNGIKVFIGGLFTNGRRFFRPAYIIPAVVLPSILLWFAARWEYNEFVYPSWKINKDMKAKFEAKEVAKISKAFRDTVATADSAKIEAGVQAVLAERKARQKWKKSHSAASMHTGKPIRRGEFWDWTDMTTPRIETAVHNLFGESLILHDDYLLCDVLKDRPVIVRYNLWLNYAIEAAIVLLFLAGIWYGRRSRFLWLSLSLFGFDMLIHMAIGFGINEIYIMSPHWSFVIPIAIAFALKHTAGRGRLVMRGVLTALAIYMFVYNVILTVKGIFS